MAEYGDQVTFDFKTGKEIRVPADDAWVIENIRTIELSADKLTIKADGEDVTVVTIKLKTGELVSKPEKRDILDDVIIGIVADGEMYGVPLIMGEGEIALNAVFAGKYAITVDGLSHNELIIEVVDAENNTGQEAAVGASEVQSAGNIEAAGESGVQSADDGAKN